MQGRVSVKGGVICNVLVDGCSRPEWCPATAYSSGNLVCSEVRMYMRGFVQGFSTGVRVVGEDCVYQVCRVYARGRSVLVCAGVRFVLVHSTGARVRRLGTGGKCPSRAIGILTCAMCDLCVYSTPQRATGARIVGKGRVCPNPSHTCTRSVGAGECGRAVCDGCPGKTTRNQCTVFPTCDRCLYKRGVQFMRVQCSSTAAQVQAHASRTCTWAACGFVLSSGGFFRQ